MKTSIELIYSRILSEAVEFKTASHDTSNIPSGDVKDILKSEDHNIAYKGVRKFAPSYDLHQTHPVSSLVHQYTIGKAFELAANENPEYQAAVHESYKKEQPEIASGTNNYKELVDKTYHAASKETGDQFDALPVSMTFHEGEHEYHNSGEMVADVHKNRHINVFSGGEEHSHFKLDPVSGLTANEKFRAVHDVYGHAVHGNQFGPVGEEIAWNAHQQMYSNVAKPAVTAETRGQNSFVNFTTHNVDNIAKMKFHREAARNSLSDSEKKFHLGELRKTGQNFNYAKQIAVVLPHEMNSPSYDGTPPSSIKHLLVDPKSRTNPEYDSKEDHLGIVKLAKLYNQSNVHEVATHLARVHGFTSVSKTGLNESMEIEYQLPEESYAHLHQTRKHSFQ